MRLPGITALAIALVVLCPAASRANPRSEALTAEAYDAAYNLDYERAKALFDQAIAADPDDAGVYRGLAGLCWMQVLFLRGTLQVDDYMGHIRSTANVPMPAPPAELATLFHKNIDRAIALGEKAVDRHYNDAASHYALGSALGIYAAYAGSVEGRLFGAMRLARRAYSESQRALDLDSRQAPAGLVAGTYRYIVSTLPAAVRLMAYIVGFGGGREQGIRLIEQAANADSDIKADAQLGLVLIYNRERRYDDAAAMARTLGRAYPQNRLFALEEASSLLRGGKAAEAERILDDGLSRLAADARPRMPGEEGRWHYKRGAARVRLGQLDEAEQDLKAAAAAPGVRGWVLARIHVEMGKVADLRGDRTTAQREYRAALAICKTAPDDPAENEATALLSKAYRQ
jgi:tetratricopeptide (TPR) repeat protein